MLCCNTLSNVLYGLWQRCNLHLRALDSLSHPSNGPCPVPGLVRSENGHGRKDLNLPHAVAVRFKSSTRALTRFLVVQASAACLSVRSLSDPVSYRKTRCIERVSEAWALGVGGGQDKALGQKRPRPTTNLFSSPLRAPPLIPTAASLVSCAYVRSVPPSVRKRGAFLSRGVSTSKAAMESSLVIAPRSACANGRCCGAYTHRIVPHHSLKPPPKTEGQSTELHQEPLLTKLAGDRLRLGVPSTQPESACWGVLGNVCAAVVWATIYGPFSLQLDSCQLISVASCLISLDAAVRPCSLFGMMWGERVPEKAVREMFLYRTGERRHGCGLNTAAVHTSRQHYILGANQLRSQPILRWHSAIQGRMT